jgi:hypothetical protein
VGIRSLRPAWRLTGRIRSRAVAVAAAALIAGTGGCGGTETSPKPLAVSLATPPREPHAGIELTGLTRDERAALAAEAPAAAAWEALFHVSVQAANLDASPPPAVAGRYALTDRGVRFTPAFPLQPGRRYDVRVNLARLQRDGTRTLATTIGLPGGPTPARAARVIGISPAGETVPENLLRIYVWFSAPMSRESGLGHVTLFDERGEVKDAFLPVDGGFWNHDFTRYTLFFDPGRVKDGILPRERMGRPLVAGRRYRLVVAPTWRDARGAPLVEPFEHRFRAAAAATQPLDIAAWQITAPHAATREPLMVRFPAALDHALAMRAIGVETSAGAALDGDVSIDGGDTRWQLVPRAPWPAGRFTLVALDVLEDPAGNRLGRAFEVPMAGAVGHGGPPRVTRSFDVARP